MSTTISVGFDVHADSITAAILDGNSTDAEVVTLPADLMKVRRFHSPRGFMAYFGLVPSERSSGERERRGPIIKAGNLHARLLHQDELPRRREIAGLEPVKIHATRMAGTVPVTGIYTLPQFFRYEDSNLSPEDVEDFQRHERRRGDCKRNAR